MSLGVVYLMLGRNDLALQYTRKATQLGPPLSAVWANYGVALSSNGKLAEAEQAYHKSLELNSDQPATSMNLATLAPNERKPGQAAGVLEILLHAHYSRPGHTSATATLW